MLPLPVENAAPAVTPAPAALTLELRTFTCEDRRDVLAGVQDAIAASGCWMLDRLILPEGRVELWFEMQLRGACDLYGALVAVGLELTRAGHADLVTLCMLRRHNPQPTAPKRLVTVRLEISFLDDRDDSVAMMAARAARA